MASKLFYCIYSLFHSDIHKGFCILWEYDSSEVWINRYWLSKQAGYSCSPRWLGRGLLVWICMRIVVIFIIIYHASPALYNGERDATFEVITCRFRDGPFVVAASSMHTYTTDEAENTDGGRELFLLCNCMKAYKAQSKVRLVFHPQVGITRPL